MRRLIGLFMMVSAVALLLSAVVLAADPEKKPVPQTTCPVMGGKINKSFYADYQGKRVYFCCSACPAEFKKDPAKYVKKLEDAGVTLEKTPAPAATTPAPVPVPAK